MKLAPDLLREVLQKESERAITPHQMRDASDAHFSLLLQQIHLLDCHLRQIPNSETLAVELNQIPGVVEHGLFIGIATDSVVGRANGHCEVVSFG